MLFRYLGDYCFREFETAMLGLSASNRSQGRSGMSQIAQLGMVCVLWVAQ